MTRGQDRRDGLDGRERREGLEGQEGLNDCVQTGVLCIISEFV